MKFRTQFEHRHVGQSFKGVVKMTDSQFKDDCTIEGIIKRYGILPRPEVQPIGADVSDLGDFAECMRRVQDGLNDFQSLPSDIRARFGNDPKAFCAWISDKENAPEAVRLGLMIERKEEVSVVDTLNGIKDGIDKLVSSKEPVSA